MAAERNSTWHLLHAPAVPRRQRVIDEVLSLTGGIGFTLGLVVAMTHFDQRKPEAPPPEFEELRAVAIPMDTPPPPPPNTAYTEPVDVGTPLAGIEMAASDSPVKIAVVPPDLDSLLPQTNSAPAAFIQTSQLYTSFKPRSLVVEDFQRVYQKSEVDQAPRSSFRAIPRVPAAVRGDAEELRVVLLLVIDTDGTVSSARVLKSSGNAQFDEIIVGDTKEEWTFTPAIKKGKKVKCMTEQTVTVRWSGSGGSPFSL